MPLFSNTEQIGSRYAAHVHEFGKLYEFHSLKSGSPQDFVQLAPKLSSSEGFRLDFSDRVRKVRDSERGRLSAGEMLTIVGIAIGGAGIAGAELDLYESAGTVQVLLAGVGGWREPEASQEPSRAGAADGLAAGESESGEYREMVRHERDGAEGGAKRDPWGNHAGGERNGGAGGEVSPEMKEALARLEMASLQLKVYLDDIDRRMGRIEPHLDDLTAMVQTSAEQFQKLERNGRETRPEISAETTAAPQRLAPPRRLRSDEVIAAAMEMASHEKEHESAAPVELLESAAKQSVAEESAAETVVIEESAAREVAEEESAAAVADEVIAPEIPSASTVAKSVGDDGVVEAKGWPIGWARKKEIATEPKPAEEIRSEERADPFPESEDHGMIAVIAGGHEAAIAPVNPKPATGWKSGIWGRRQAAWGAAAAVFLIAAASLAYVYQPWRVRADQAAGEGVAAPAAAGGATEAAPSGTPERPVTPADGVTARGSGSLRNGAAVSNTPAEIAAGRASANSRRNESAVRQPSGAQPRGTQANGTTPVANAGGGGGAGVTPVPGAIANLPQGAPVIRAGASQPTNSSASQARTQAEPPKDRVEGARAADVSRAPRVENLHPETTAERATPGGGPSPQIETAAMVSKVSAPSAGGPSAAPAAAGNVPRSSIGRPEVGPPTIAVAIISAPSPTYPQQARQLGVEGKVVIQATVNKSGTVTSARVVEGPFLLRQSAQDAVLRRRYKPYLLHGDPAEFQTLVTLNYKLSK